MGLGLGLGVGLGWGLAEMGNQIATILPGRSLANDAM